MNQFEDKIIKKSIETDGRSEDIVNIISEIMILFQKVCLDRSLQIPQICKYSDFWFQNNTPRRVVLIFVL